jgi:hypothetical protein
MNIFPAFNTARLSASHFKGGDLGDHFESRVGESVTGANTGIKFDMGLPEFP